MDTFLLCWKIGVKLKSEKVKMAELIKGNRKVRKQKKKMNPAK